jgi:cytolysin (calcineurin-like family phosphatase)
MGVPTIGSLGSRSYTGYDKSSDSFSYSVGSGDDRLLLVRIHYRNGPASPTSVSSVTYNGVALTKQETRSGAQNCDIWYLVNPPTRS